MYLRIYHHFMKQILFVKSHTLECWLSKEDIIIWMSFTVFVLNAEEIYSCVWIECMSLLQIECVYTAVIKCWWYV